MSESVDGGVVNSWKEALYRSYVSSGQVVDSGASAREHFEGRRAFLEGVIGSYFPSNRAAQIIDIGCGHGALLYFLSKAGYRNLQGIDGSPEQVALAKRLQVPGVELADGYSFICGLTAGSAEVICLFDVLEHLSRQQCFNLLMEVRRVLAPAGLCIGHVPNAEGIFGSRIRYGDLTHEQGFAASSVRQLFRSLQFSEVSCFEDKPAAHGLKSAVRRIIWDIGTVPFRLLCLAETGSSGAILSQNLLFVARR